MFPFLNYFREMNLAAILLRVTLALLIGGLLGMERGRKHHPAGFRTYMLVCLGAAMVMMTNQYASEYFGGGDPVRMGAQVVSGIGFLGAGTIMVTGKQQIKGITTAAGLWTAACCGLAIGIGFYEMALLGGIAIWMVMAVFTRFDERIHRLGHNMEIYIEFKPEARLSNFLGYARGLNMEIFDIQIQKDRLQEHFNTVILTVRSHEPHEATMEKLSRAPEIHYIEELRG